MDTIKKPLLLGFGSRAQIGKDFGAAGLRTFFSIKRVAFADKLKEQLNCCLTPTLGINLLSSDIPIEVKEKLRPLMVEYGCTMRSFDPDYWVNAALTAEVLDAPVDLVIVTDVRFPNEVRRLKELGGVYIDISTNTGYANETEASEAPRCRDMADYIIYNSFDESYIPSLKSLVDTILAKQN